MGVGATTTLKQADGKIKLHLRTNWLSGVLVLGIGAGGSMALCMGLFNLIAHNPDQGFALLKSWGPWAIVVALALLLAWKVSSQAIGVVRVGVEAFMRNSDRMATASEGQTASLAKLAEQGGRNAEEVRRLATYAAQEFPSVYARLDQQDAMLQSNHDATMAVHGVVERLIARLDGAAGRGQG